MSRSTDSLYPTGVRSIFRRRPGEIGVYAVLVVFAVWYLLPLAVVLSNAFRDLSDIAATGLIGIPRTFSSKAWLTAWSSYCVAGTCAGIAPSFFNSLALAVPATIISTAIGAINGYVLSMWRFRGSELVFGAMTLGVFMPGQVVLLPWAFILGKLGLSNTIAGLILIHCVQGVSFTTLFCRSYYTSIPEDLIKAARLDGAGFWRIFYRIVLPLSPPIIVVTVIWQFTSIWNDFLYAVVFTSGRTQPITASIIALATPGQAVQDFDVASAAVLIAAAPPLLVYLLGGRYFVRGLTEGAIR